MAENFKNACDDVPKYRQDYSISPYSHRWVFLTLTVKNPHVSDTRQTLKEMNAGWQRMVQSKRFKGVVDGFIRTTEITRPEKKSERMNVHPHFHAMLLVNLRISTEII